MPLRCLISNNNDPFFNLSVEEYFLKNIEDEVFMLYANKPSIVVGKHQNLVKEINVPWSNKHNIKIVRRLSGGGTVYQDEGNLNFSFISNCPNLEKVNYQRFTSPIVHSINQLDVKAVNSERNDLILNGLKISGNAMHIHKNRVLCHGTLLFQSNLQNLSIALKGNPERYLDKAIKSVPSKVSNISDHLIVKMSMEHFKRHIFEKTAELLNSPQLYTLTESDLLEIQRLSIEKYSTWDWIYGYSPNYTFRNSLQLKNRTIGFQLYVEKGLIKTFDLEDKEIQNQISNLFLMVKHDYNSIRLLFENEKIKEIFKGHTSEEFCQMLF